MIEVKFKINNRVLTVDEVKDQKLRTLCAHATSVFTEQLGTIHCRTHDLDTLVVVHNANRKFAGFEFTGCCQEFVDNFSKMAQMKVPDIELKDVYYKVRVVKYKDFA